MQAVFQNSLLLLDFKALAESSVGEGEVDLCVALGFSRLALAFVAAETNLDPADFDVGVRIELATGEWAFHLGCLAGRDQLVIGLRGELGGILGESTGAVATAEINLGTLVISGLVLQSGFTRNWASCLEWLGFFIGSKRHETNSQYRTHHDTDITHRHNTDLFLVTHKQKSL